MSEIHSWVGFGLVALFAVGWMWGLGAWIVRRGPGDRYWNWLTVAQVVALIQALVGLVLLLMGLRPNNWLHYVYGFGSLFVLAVAHFVARQVRRPRPGAKPIDPWIPFAFAAFICFGLALRALMTGLGIG
jgi:hypothetical protein